MFTYIRIILIKRGEQLTREMYDLPTVEFSNVDLLGGEFDFEVKDYKYHPSIKAPLSN